jgi:hypothetical protein
MATFKEIQGSRTGTTGDNPTRTLRFRLDGTSDDATARAIAESSSPLTHDGLYRQNIDLEEVVVDSTAGTGTWVVTVRYGKRPTAIGEYSTSFDTSGGTQHITQAIKHMIWEACPPHTAAANFKGAIGVSSSGVAGVDVIVPSFAWSETHTLTNAQVNQYKSAWYTLTGSVNNAPFRTFDIGEVKLLGVSGTRRNETEWSITVKFAASPNVTDFCADWPADIKPTKPIFKRGWEYAWVEYSDDVDVGAVAFVKRPKSVHVEQVSPTGDLRTLGIGS